MMRLMNILMLSCRKATELMEKRLHTRLRSIEKFQLFMHSQMCDACRSYEKQNHFMDDMLRNQSKTSYQPKSSLKKLPDEVKSKIIKELNSSKIN